MSWILDQKLEADREEEATGLVESLRVEVEALKEQARHMQRQKPKPKRKPKKAAINGGKQKNKYKKPQPAETREGQGSTNGSATLQQ